MAKNGQHQNLLFQQIKHPSAAKMSQALYVLDQNFGLPPRPYSHFDPIMNTHKNRSKDYIWICHGLIDCSAQKQSFGYLHTPTKSEPSF